MPMNNQEDRAFSRGMIVALACVDDAGEEVTYREIVGSAGGARRLIREAVRSGMDYDLKHLLKYYSSHGAERGRVRYWEHDELDEHVGRLVERLMELYERQFKGAA